MAAIPGDVLRDFVPALEPYRHRAAARERTAHRPVALSRTVDPWRHQLLLRFAVMNLAGGGLLGAAWAYGLVERVLSADPSGLCLLIFAVFLGGLALCALRVWRVSVELNQLAGARVPDALPAGPVAAVQRAPAGRRADVLAALRLRLSHRITIVRHVGGNLVMMGLIGTVVGFIIALSGVDAGAAGDVQSIAPMVSTLISGMSTALYTTLVGSVLNLWLMANYQLLAGGTVRLLAGLTEFGADADA